MRLSYALTEAGLRIATRRSFSHRLRILGPLLKIGGLGLIVAAPFYLFMDHHRILGVAMLVVGLIAFFRRELGAWKGAKDALKGKGSIDCVIEMREGGLDIDAGTSKASHDWESFFEAKEVPEGMLLYISKQIFYWIPREAQMEGGNWEEFSNLIAENVRRKI